MTTIRVQSSHRWLAAAVIAALATVSQAQVRQIQLNNPMDANPGVGSGGSNQPVPGYVPINGNDVVTGNVTGLGYFHGRTSITSPYSFQGNLGTAALSGFARQSAPAAPNGAPTTYYLPSATVSTAQGSLYSAPIGSGFDSRLVPVTSYNPSASAAQIRALNASVSGQAVDRLPTQFAQPDANAQGGLLNNPLFVLRTTAEMERLRREQLEQAATRPAPPREGSTTQPTLMLQEQVDASRNPATPLRSPEARGGMALDESVNANVGAVYAKLAQELKQAQGPSTDTQTLRPVNMALTVGDIDPLTGRPRLVASTGNATATPPGGAAATRPATRPGTTASASGNPTSGIPASLSAKSLEELPTARLAAGSKIKPQKMAPAPTSSATPAAFDLLMVRGEQALKDGKYVDAQISYRSALANKPDDALALVGLANAELGAGAYVAAAYDLKFVFTRRPEMIAVRYDPGSFIPVARHDYLLNDLQRQTAKKETADAASFLYCYLCYQTGRKTQLGAELKKWGAREGHDSWQSVVKRAWTEEPLLAPEGEKKP